MPTKPLTPEQTADAARLKAAFKAWQAGRREAALPATQDEVAEQLFGFGQSALSQYLNGTIPLNWSALRKFCKQFAVAPETISPGIFAAERERALEWLDFDAPAGSPAMERPSNYTKQRHRPAAAKRQKQG